MSSPVNTIAENLSSPLAVISLGSNLPLQRVSGLQESAAILRQALRDLQELSSEPLVSSSFYRTTPLDSPAAAPDFINAIALLRPFPNVAALELLQCLHSIETKFGRARDLLANSPRSLDLDLISFGNMQCQAPGLILPHPRALLRRFVMTPLSEVAPALKLPGQDLTASEQAELLETLQASQQIQRL